MYDTALQRLADAGFRQVTMRQFRRGRPLSPESDDYACQADGTVGLARAPEVILLRLHYSTPWKMVARNIRGVVADYEDDLDTGQFRVRHGFALDADERRRRFVILSLLYDGLRWDAFRTATGADARTLYADQWRGAVGGGLRRAR
jgi:oxygen-independent coproporphyrinogen-3 oxidase